MPPSIDSKVYLTAFVFLEDDRWGEGTEARRIWLAYPIRKPVTPGAGCVNVTEVAEIICELKTLEAVFYYRTELV